MPSKRSTACGSAVLAGVIAALLPWVACLSAEPGPDRPSLAQALKRLRVPPPWFADTEIHYDSARPWKEARLEIRRLLGLGESERRQAIKLTCIYRDKGDIGDGHEYPMYLYLGGEYAWAIRAYEAWLAHGPKHALHAFRCLASAYRHFGEFNRAADALERARSRLPDPPWHISGRADLHDSLGDLYADMGDPKAARREYEQAAKLYPTSQQPYGRHLLGKRAGKVRSKIDMLTVKSLVAGGLHDGSYTGESLGYGKPLKVTVTVVHGRIADIAVEHHEKIEQGATRIIPRRIVEQQSLPVDGITGATVTVDAIHDATLTALRNSATK